MPLKEKSPQIGVDFGSHDVEGHFLIGCTNIINALKCVAFYTALKGKHIPEQPYIFALYNLHLCGIQFCHATFKMMQFQKPLR